MVVIRLNRGGSKKRPKYRVTVADSRAWLGGRFLEVIGSFNPHPRGSEKKLVIDLERAEAWMKLGAQPTSRVKSLMKMAKSWRSLRLIRYSDLQRRTALSALVPTRSESGSKASKDVTGVQDMSQVQCFMIY